MTERGLAKTLKEEAIEEIFEQGKDGWEVAEQLIEFGLGAQEIVDRMQKENYTAVSNDPSELRVRKEKGDGYAVRPHSKIFQLEPLL